MLAGGDLTTGTPMAQEPVILGIETSCDDTAAAVVAGGRVLSNVVMGQAALHDGFGGVVPEIAARAHAEAVDHAVEAALAEAGIPLAAIDAVAVTAGPGLIGGVLAGTMCAKGIALATGKPLVAVNHLAGHALTPRLTDGLPYPYLVLLASGGHCQFLRVDGPRLFGRLGGTIDDAPGEAFDKVARLLGLGQPGGPAVEREAREGAETVPLPRPLLDRPGLDLSFSGLKTAVLRARDDALVDGALPRRARADLCASFQGAVRDALAAKTARALAAHPLPALAVAGGVAANAALRAALEAVAREAGSRFVAPPLALCTDNAAMIAHAAAEMLLDGHPPDRADFPARPRWPLDTEAAPMLGSGKRGAKA